MCMFYMCMLISYEGSDTCILQMIEKTKNLHLCPTEFVI